VVVTAGTIAGAADGAVFMDGRVGDTPDEPTGPDAAAPPEGAAVARVGEDMDEKGATAVDDARGGDEGNPPPPVPGSEAG
jgi:hypothetical protein